jgi:hypothetical protein
MERRRELRAASQPTMLNLDTEPGKDFGISPLRELRNASSWTSSRPSDTHEVHRGTRLNWGPVVSKKTMASARK